MYTFMSMCTVYVYIHEHVYYQCARKMYTCIHVANVHVSIYADYASLDKSKEKPMDELHDAFKLFVDLITGPHKAL